jgi:hypothetical protein
MAEVIHDADGDHVHIPVTEARQGRWGRHVLWVLLASTLLAAIALFAAWGMKSGDLQSTEAVEAHRTLPNQPSSETPPPAQTGPSSIPAS